MVAVRVMKPLRTLLAAVSGLALTAGAGLLSYAVVQALAGGRQPATTGAAYVEAARCDGCPAGISLDSVQVQQRQGSILFVVRGRLPAGVAGLGASSVRLEANDAELVLKPYAAKGAFEMVRAARSATPLPAGAVAASLRSGALLIDVSPAAVSAPVRFAVGLWDGSQYTGRLPRAGSLVWDGAPAMRASAGPVAVVDPTALARACDQIPQGTVPPYLRLGALNSGVQADPRTHAQTPSVSAALAASPLGVKAVYAMGAIVRRSADAAAGSGPRPIDRAGSVQLWVFGDDQARHKAVRTFQEGRWSVQLDSEADVITYRIAAGSVTFYWAGLKTGDRFGFVTAAPGGACHAAGLDASLAAQQTVS